MLQKKDISQCFFEKPTGRFMLRELARLSKLSTTAVRARLDRLLAKKIIRKEREKHLLFYKANWDAPEYKLAKKAYTVERIILSGVIDYLDAKLNYPEAVFLFGSAARGEDAEHSDIDLFVLSVNKREVNMRSFEKSLGKPIKLHIFNREDLRTARLKNKEMLNNVINGVLLRGYLGLL